ncbi:hypothetical protein TNCV_3638061 [Trichonephila clavipes]|nr:hypothetical protein TNCV_3638061 [Trichonephila clavipes]
MHRGPRVSKWACLQSYKYPHEQCDDVWSINTTSFAIHCNIEICRTVVHSIIKLDTGAVPCRLFRRVPFYVRHYDGRIPVWIHRKNCTWPSYIRYLDMGHKQSVIV